MSNNKDKSISELLADEYVNSIPESQDHAFSNRFVLKLDSLFIRTKLKSFGSVLYKITKIAACFFAAAIFIFTGNVFYIHSDLYPVAGFYMQVVPDSIVFEINYERELKPSDFVQEEYEVTYDLSQFGLKVKSYNVNVRIDQGYISKFVSYQMDDQKTYFSFQQCDKYAHARIFIDDDSYVEVINFYGKEGLYTHDHSWHSIYWIADGYVFSVGGDDRIINKNELIEIAGSVQKVEK